MNNKEQIQSKLINSIYDWLNTFVFGTIIIVLILTFFIRMVDIDGRSMLPTLVDKEKVVVTNNIVTPDNGDVVIISHGEHYKNPLVKRVIATEGQRLKIDFKNNKVYVNGKVVDEPYIRGITIPEDGKIPSVIPKGKVFVMGDNREESSDSRCKKIGLINEKDIIGKVRCVIFPFNRIRLIK